MGLLSGLLLSSSASAAASCTTTSAPAASATSATASAAAERTLAAGTLPDAAAHGSPQRLGLQRLDTGHLDPHRSSVERNSVVLFQCFHGISPPVEGDLGSAQTPAASVVVHGGHLEVPELAEELVDVGVRDAEVQVGDDELAGGGDAGGSHAASAPAAAGVHVVVPLTVRVAPGVAVASCAAASASELVSPGSATTALATTSTTVVPLAVRVTP